MTKIYTKNTWVDEVLASDPLYDILNSDDTEIYTGVKVSLATEVSVAGTGLTADNMNNIEDGVDALDDTVNVDGVELIKESGGDTVSVGSVDEDEFLRREGNNVVGKTIAEIKTLLGLDFIGVSAYKSAAQSNLTNNTWTKVTFDTEVYDTGEDFASSTFTVPVNGYYFVRGLVTFDSADMVADKLYNSAIYVDGAVVQYGFAHSTMASAALGVPVAKMFYLTAGQTVELYARQVSGGNTIDIGYGASVTNLDITLVRPA